jgi:hypothetical protein
VSDASIADMAQLVSDWRPHELDRMRQTVLDAACGLVLAAPAKKRGVPGLGDEYLGEHETEWGTFHLYKRAPDTSMLKLLVEQNLGRPGNRSTEKVDPLIQIFTAVEGFEERALPQAGEPITVPALGASFEGLDDL